MEVPQITRSQTVTVALFVGNVQVDADTFTLHPTIARIANKITTIPHNETHQFRPAANRAPGAITWAFADGSTSGDAGTINRRTGHWTPPPAQPSAVTYQIDMLLDGTVTDSALVTVPRLREGPCRPHHESH